MISVEAARTLARDRVAKRLGEWAAEVSPPIAASPSFAIPLKPPTEAQALANLGAAEAWARSWRATELPPECELDWETRNWRRIGRQEVPVRLRFSLPDAVASFAGGASARDWCTVRDRATLAASRFEASEALGAVIRRHVRTILGYRDAEWEEVLTAVEWLAVNSVAGLRPRQLPMRGVDTKWFAAHRTVVKDLLAVTVPGHDLGVIDSDVLTRVRVLDPMLAAEALGGLADFAAPVAQLTTLEISARVVFIFENKESVLAMPEWPGAVVVHGGGLAVGAVADLPWVQRCPVVYWGDLDSAGFAILNRLRHHHARVTAVLMDEDTLFSYRDLWVTDGSPTRGELTELLPAEQRTRDRLRVEGDARLEQERIPWAVALRALENGALRV